MKNNTVILLAGVGLLAYLGMKSSQAQTATGQQGGNGQTQSTQNLYGPYTGGYVQVTPAQLPGTYITPDNGNITMPSGNTVTPSGQVIQGSGAVRDFNY